MISRSPSNSGSIFVKSKKRRLSKSPSRSIQKKQSFHLNERLPPGKKRVNIKIRIERKTGKYHIYQNNTILAQFREEIKINKEAFMIFKQLKESSHILKRFDPPQFGITTLGNSHGFDALGSTSGFIIWIGGKGIMVDPPPFSSYLLKIEGIHPSLIEKIILSHCHADHDSGAFHKILEAEPVELLSTETILRSFIRKYSAITGVKISEVNKLARFRGVKIGHPINIHGARFRFFYSFHSIPAIGFDVEYNGKSFYFSGDTYFDPVKLKDFYQNKKLFSYERYQELAHKDFSKYDLVFHEAGIPPIHTPQDAIISSTKNPPKQIFLYHCTHSSIKYKSLKVVPLGLRNTIILIDNKHDPNLKLVSKDLFRTNLELLASVSLVSWLPINRMLELLEVIKTVSYPPFTSILKAGSFGSKFYIIKKGSVRIFLEGEKGFEKLIGPCDYFGESAIFENGYRLANVESLRETELIEIDKFDFYWVFADPTLPDVTGPEGLAPPIRRIKNLSQMRMANLGEFINFNNFIKSLSEVQKNKVNMLIKEKKTNPGEILWKKDDLSSFCFFVKTGKFQMVAPQKYVPKNFVLKKGSLVGDFPNLLQKVPTRSAVKSVSQGSIMILSADKLRELVTDFPSLLVYLRDKFLIF